MRVCLVALLVGLILPTVTFAQDAVVSGTIYHDADRSSLTAYVQDIGGDDVVLPDVRVVLIDPAGEAETLTDENGEFAFDALTPGTYFVTPDLYGHESTSNNAPRRTPAALREGALHIVALGDSIGIEGPEFPYPERLGWLFDELADVTVDNVCVSGSHSWEWLPGAEAAYFEDRLLPLLPTADAVTVTITGNDLDPYVAGMPPYDVWQIILNFLEHPEYLFGAVPNLRTLLNAIVTENPDVDLVFVMYPNFGNSSYIIEDFGELLQPLIAVLMEFVSSLERAAAADTEPIVIADTIEALGDTWLDPYLVDEVHPSDEGSQVYAEEIFKALGGLVVTEETTTVVRDAGFYAPDLVPADDDDDDDDDNDDNNDNDDNDDNDNDDNDNNDDTTTDDDNDDNDDTTDDDDDNDDASPSVDDKEDDLCGC